MKKFLLAVFLAILSITSFASEWSSPIDKKYLSKDPELFQLFEQARDLLDSSGGEREKLHAADRLLQEILLKDAEYAPAHREYGRLYIMAGYVNYDNFREGSLDLAEVSILQSLKIEPEYADSYVLLGHLYTNMKRYEEAEIALLRAEEIGTETPWLNLNWADLLQERGDYASAMQRYQEVVQKGTENRKAYSAALSGVTTMHRYMGQYDEAKNGYLMELAYDPEDAWEWGNYSNFLLFTYKDVDGAIENGRKALEIRDYGMGRFILACALYTKWAMLKDDPAAQSQAQKYFDEAWLLYPYLEKVIEKTKKYPYTRIASSALTDWLERNQSQRGGVAPAI